MNKKEIVDSIIERIEIKLQDKHNVYLSDVVEMSGYSKRYVQKAFKDIMGMNVTTYIKRRKLTQAAVILKLTKKKLYHIAMDFNFTTQQSFTRSFLREFNVTPTAYRNEPGFDCSRLFLVRGKHWDIHNPVKKTINPLKLNVDRFQYRDGLLNRHYERGYKIRLKKITSILAMENEAIIVTNIYPNSLLGFEVDLIAMAGYIDSVNYNYEIEQKDYWELKYNGTWNNYIDFGRFFLYFIDIRFGFLVIEFIQKGDKNRDGEQLYKIKMYLSIP